MYNNMLTVGDKIELRKVSGHGKVDKEKLYVSQLLEICSEKEANIAMPVDGEKTVAVEIGERFELVFYTKNGLYQCLCRVTNRFRENNLLIAVIEFLSDFEKYQRRQYFRLECLIDISCRLMSEQEVIMRKKLKNPNLGSEDKKIIEEWLKDLPVKWNPAVMIDISGGGARINSVVQFEKEQIIMIMLTIGIEKTLKKLILCGKIITNRKIQNRNSTYEHRVEFIDITRENRELIVKYVFEEQRKRRRKERGL